MNRSTIVVALCAFIAGVLTAHAIDMPVYDGVAQPALVSPFALMVKAGNLPAESFDTI